MGDLIPLEPPARRRLRQLIGDQGDELVPHEGWPETCRACAIAHRNACWELEHGLPTDES